MLSYAMWAYATSAGHIAENLPTRVKQYTARRLLTGPLIAALALLASLVQPVWAEYIFCAMVPLFMFSARFAERQTGDPA
jgi:hypothetical protein